jgi:RNA polymerase sigma-70 factor (sigma-E family)
LTGQDGFREFVEARYTQLLGIAYLLAGSSHEAEDVLQSALARAMRRWNRIDDPVAYVRRVMINVQISFWRRHRGRELLTPVRPDGPVADGSEDVLRRQALFKALRTLPPKTRAVLVLRYWADLSEADVAAELGCSVGTVKSRASRGLARLREHLEPPTEPSRTLTQPVPRRI